MNTQIDCACVIHGPAYDWQYVEKLYNMLTRNLPGEIRLHVFTEKDRPVPKRFIKHNLTEWSGINGSRRAWWYKMQLFDPCHGIEKILYFDLDTVIIRNIDWILNLDPAYFWSILDFRRLWKPLWQGMNSSVMYWDCKKFSYVWDQFNAVPLATTMKHYHGDQDFLTDVIPVQHRHFMDERLIKSWRWQIVDGGLDPKKRCSIKPGAGAIIDSETHIVVFHGSPKPHEVTDSAIIQHWS